jgi:diguanylate cyclase (GGDEF)-like protein
VAEALRSPLRGTDIVARLGGDEFAVLLPRGGADPAERVCEALEREIPAEVRAPDGRGVEVSAGLAPFEEGVQSVDDVLSAADTLMYAAKAGRPRRPDRDR